MFNYCDEGTMWKRKETNVNCPLFFSSIPQLDSEEDFPEDHRDEEADFPEYEETHVPY